VVTYRRQRLFRNAVARRFLGEAMREVRTDAHFDTIGFVILPDHLHCMWSLPEGDGDFSRRWSQIKRLFTRRWLASGGSEREVSASRARHGEKGVWQRRFWEHLIRDEDDMVRHLDYIHFNPVKHGLVECPHAWPHSSFERCVREGYYAREWQCVCAARRAKRPDFTAIEKTAME